MSFICPFIATPIAEKRNRRNSPKMSELLSKRLESQCFEKCNVVPLRETMVHVPDLIHSRFDFSGIGKSNTLPNEVKNVPAYYEDLEKNEKQDYSHCDFDSKVAYFPDGYRKILKIP